MLGRTARWLRALGHDVWFDPNADDTTLARLAREHHRVLLTRDRRLCTERGSPSWCVVLNAARPADQLLELDRAFQLFGSGWTDLLFTRCLVCGERLTPVADRSIRARLPPDVRADPRVRSAGYRLCPGCQQVFWDGSHTRRMRRWLHRVAGRSQ